MTATRRQASDPADARAGGSRFSLGGRSPIWAMPRAGEWSARCRSWWRATRSTPARIYASRNGGPEQLRKNLARVLGVHARQSAGRADPCFAGLLRPILAGGVPVAVDGQGEARGAHSSRVCSGSEHIRAGLDAGRGVVMPLPHSGNWDMAGVWMVQHFGTFTTVAERLKPESLYQRFIDYRESLGFEMLPLTGGERPPFEVLDRAAARQRDRVPDGRPRPHRGPASGRLLRRADPDARGLGEARDRDRRGRCCRRTATTRATAGSSTCHRAAGHVVGRRRRDHAGDGRPVRQGHRRPSRGLAHAAAAVAGRPVRGAAGQAQGRS